MKIKVEARTGLGDTILWEGPAEDVSQIRNVEARTAARLTVKDGQPHDVGMFYAFQVPEENQDEAD